jgi:hypothetical protein
VEELPVLVAGDGDGGGSHGCLEQAADPEGHEAAEDGVVPAEDGREPEDAEGEVSERRMPVSSLRSASQPVKAAMTGKLTM